MSSLIAQSERRELSRKIPDSKGIQAPCALADALGHAYATKKSPEHRKQFGLFLTPEPVARFMAEPIRCQKTKVRLLDPAAGAGILICAAVERFVKAGKVEEIEIVAHEIDGELARLLEDVLKNLKEWAFRRGVRVMFEIRQGDFILTECISLAMLETIDERARYDVVICNPPYLKIGKNDARAAAASEVVHGQPNIYGIFMAVSAALLRQGGEFVFITPRSFASGPYFQRFREWFFKRIRPIKIHVFGSRKDAFGRDEVLQENVIFHGSRENGGGVEHAQTLVSVTTSHGLSDLGHVKSSLKPWGEMIAGHEQVLRIPGSKEEEDALQKVESWHGSLASYGLKISTGPVVAFRATKWLKEENKSGETVPLLWLNHVFPLELHWPNGVRKPQYISQEAASEKLLLPNRNYVVMRRFSAKEDARRLTAAPILGENESWKMVGLENHLNYVYRPNGSLTIDEVWGLAALYSSKLLDSYFRCVNGNTQVSATELRSMPLPSLEAIRELGRKVRRIKSPLGKVDDLLAKVLAH